MTCRDCGAQLPEGTRICPECGRPQLQPLEPKRRKRLRRVLIPIALALLAVGAAFGTIAAKDGGANDAAKEAVCDQRFADAEAELETVRLFQADDAPIWRALIRAGQLADAGQYVHVLNTLDELRADYDTETLAAYRGVMDQLEATAEPALYVEAQAAYGDGDFVTAFGGFDTLAARDYADSGDWLFLTQAQQCADLEKLADAAGLTADAAAERLLGLLGKADVNKLVARVDSYLARFLTGTWRSDDGAIVLAEETDAGLRVTCTLPGVSEGQVCTVTGGTLYVRDADETGDDPGVAFYELSILNRRALIADSTGDGRVYTLQPE